MTPPDDLPTEEAFRSAWAENYRLGLAVLTLGLALAIAYGAAVLVSRSEANPSGSVWTGLVLPAVGIVGFGLLVAGGILVFHNRSLLRLASRHD